MKVKQTRGIQQSRLEIKLIIKIKASEWKWNMNNSIYALCVQSQQNMLTFMLIK